MTFLSVVIPVYNVRDYLVRCIDSVIAECDNITYEVLLVDDGSTDGSGRLCDEIAERLSHVMVLHKPNGGLSDARNYGVAHAVGEYVFYLDSDDYLVKDGLRAEMEAAKELGSDVVCGNFYYNYSDHVTLFNDQPYQTFTVEGGEEALRLLIEGKYYQNFAWGKLIRRELAQKYLFPKGRLFEDTYWFHRILQSARKVTVVNAPVVYYEQRDGSISFQYKLKNLDILDGYAERLDFLLTYYPVLADSHKRLMAQTCIDHSWMICRYLKNDEKKTAIARLRCVVADCNLQENALLNSMQKRKLQMIMKSMLMYKCSTILDKIIRKILK